MLAERPKSHGPQACGTLLTGTPLSLICIPGASLSSTQWMLTEVQSKAHCIFLNRSWGRLAESPVQDPRKSQHLGLALSTRAQWNHLHVPRTGLNAPLLHQNFTTIAGARLHLKASPGPNASSEKRLSSTPTCLLFFPEPSPAPDAHPVPSQVPAQPAT